MDAREVPQIDYDAPDPPMRQIADWLREEIRSGRIPPGKKIPSETWLVQAFGVARTTVRRSVALLRDEGVITTIQGRGSWAVDRR